MKAASNPARLSIRNQFTKIESQDDIARGLEILISLDPGLAQVATGLDEIPLRLRPANFDSLCDIITGQQVSKASAAAMMGRLRAAIDPLTAEAFLQAGEKVWIAAGLSHAKQVALCGLAGAICSQELDLADLATQPVDKATKRLTAFKGIGPWTAEVFLLFCAGHPDVFPSGDVALQQAIADLDGLETRPSTKEAAAIANRWSPVRGVAARILWAFYAQRRRKGILPV